MSQITTEITSSKIASDNPIHQRLLYAYKITTDIIYGDVLEVGCGEGRGLETIAPFVKNYTALDKNKPLLDSLSQTYPSFSFIETTVPPFHGIADNSFDTVIAFQVIEHIKDDHLFVKEIYRVLKPGGQAIITTPNITLSLTRNPWHIREYTFETLTKLLKKYFSSVTPQGISGNSKVWDYYQINKKSVEKYTRWDIFRVQYWLPASILRIPYDILNRKNREKMMKTDTSLVGDITIDDFSLSSKPVDCFDLYFVAKK